MASRTRREGSSLPRRTRERRTVSSEPERKRDTTFRDFVLDQLSGMPELLCNPMFGGFGLYCGEAFFAIIGAGQLYFLTDEATRKTYIGRGKGPFRPSESQTLSSYYEVPLDVLEDAEELEAWARQAVRVRLAIQRAKRRTAR